MSLTRAQTRAILYDLGWGLGFASTATTIATGTKTIVDAVRFENAAAGEGNYRGRYMYRPAAAAANRIREAVNVSGTGLVHEGTAYSGDGSVLDYEIVGMMHPDELNRAIREALRKVYYKAIVPVNLPPASGSSDDDFAASSASTPYDWTAAGIALNTTVTKSATAADNRRGAYSLICTNSAANGRTRSAIINVTPGDVLIHGAGVRATTGSAIYRLLNVTNSNSEIGTAITITSQVSQHFIRQDTIPAGCYQVRRQLEGSGASDVTIWDYLFSHLQGIESRQLIVPSWLSDNWRLSAFGPARYGRSVASNQYNASSQMFTSWPESSDWDLYPLEEDATPSMLEIKRPEGLGFEDYWYHGLRPFSDVVDLDDETDPTNAPQDLFMASVKVEVAKVLLSRSRDPFWEGIIADNMRSLAVQRQSRPKVQPKRIFQFMDIGRGIGHL